MVRLKLCSSYPRRVRDVRVFRKQHGTTHEHTVLLWGSRGYIERLCVCIEMRGTSQQPRARRACFGELVQIDGCEHRWFEEGAPGPAVTEVARGRFAGAVSLRQLFLCRRGRPPFLPFSRELIALRAEVLEPA